MEKIHLDVCKPITDKSGKQWLPASIVGIGERPVEVIEVGEKESECDYYEVIGYSEKRKAYWIEKIDFENITNNLEDELEEYVNRMGHG